MKNKTVVEWLVDQVNTDCLDPIYIRRELIEQANAIFEEQIENAYFNGSADNMNDEGSFKEYYNEKYGGDK
jgi:hypothetical protein